MDASKLPEGKYQAVVKESYIKTLQSGDDCIAIRFNIVDGPYKGVEIAWNGYLSEEMRFDSVPLVRTMSTLRACGWNGHGGIDQIDWSLCARPVEIVTHHKEYKGKMEVFVKYVNGGDRNAVSADKAKEISDRVVKAYKDFEAGTPSTTEEPF